MSRLWLAIVFDDEGQEPFELLKNALMSHSSLLDGVSHVELGGRRYKIESMPRVVNGMGDRHFDIRFEFGSFLFVRMPQYSISSMQIRDCISSNADAGVWLENILMRKDFIQAFLYDEEYDLLQNATQPATYRMRNKSLDDVVLYWDKALNREFIDISKNPGRRTVREGYFEAIGHIMWLSPKFWQRTSGAIDNIRGIPKIDSINKIGDIDVICFQKSPFLSSKGKNGQFQSRIRATLFPTGV